jgi:hypothetical protein
MPCAADKRPDLGRTTPSPFDFAFSSSPSEPYIPLPYSIFDMVSFTILASMLLGASAVVAKPTPAKQSHHSKCDVSKASVSATFPSGQNQLHGQSHGPNFIGETFVA